MNPSLFSLGQLLATPSIASSISPADVSQAISRHSSGDWGDMCEEDKAENDFSLQNGFRLLSAYTSSEGIRFWVITEADRSATTVLLPEEY